MYNFQRIICSDCNNAAAKHPIASTLLTEGCTRDFHADAYVTDSWDDYYSDTYLTVNDTDSAYRGNGTQDYSDRWAIESDPTDTFFTSGAYERWVDSDPCDAKGMPLEFTPVMHYRLHDQWYAYDPSSVNAKGSLPSWLGPQSTLTNDPSISRNVYVEGSDGFHTIQAYDPTLTERYSLRLINAYVDREGSLRVGGSKVTKSETHVISTCVQSKCQATVTVPLDSDRPTLEGFVLDVIRHGNNHAASWFRSRSTFYKVHTDWCDLNCQPNEAHCGLEADALARKLNVLRSFFNLEMVA